MRGGRGAHRTQPPSGARGSARAAVRAAGEGGGDDGVGRRSNIRIAGDSGGDDRHWEAAEGESTRRTRADFAGSQAMVGAAHRIPGSERTGGGGERWRQRKAAAQQIPVLRRSHAESRMGSIQHAVGTRGPGRCRRHGPSFSDGGINPFRQGRSPFQRKKRAIRERGVLWAVPSLRAPTRAFPIRPGRGGLKSGFR